MNVKLFSALLLLVALIIVPSAGNHFAWSSSSDPSSTVSSSFWGTPPDWENTSESECRFCHEDLVRFPQLAGSNPDKHHALIGSLIEAPVIAPYGVEGDTYQCMSCHVLIWSETTLSYNFEDFRDCLACHPVNSISGNLQSDNVHHSTETFYNATCSTCHPEGHR